MKPKKPRSRGAFALHDSPHGLVSLRHVPSGEIMHSGNDPDVEAARVYVEQSAILAHALGGPRPELRADLAHPATDPPRPLVVWDVGLGAGHNAMALVRAVDQATDRAIGHAPIELVSFERDLDALRLALDHVEHFPHLRHRAPHVVAHRGSYRRERFSWSLREGDFLATFATEPRPDVIFYDPFSARVDAPMWSLAAFTRLFAYLAGPVELFTSTSSTAIRSAMLVAGFHVARGVASGLRPETTIALTHPGAPHALLGRDWLDKHGGS